MADTPLGMFELHLAPTEQDATLVLNDPTDDTLDLEIWYQVNSAAPGALVQSVSAYLEASDDGVVVYNADFASDLPWFACVFGGTDNEPHTGDFSPLCLSPLGLADGLGGPVLWGTFSVTALSPGTMRYSFSADEADNRPWFIALTDGSEYGSGDLSGIVDPAVAVIKVVAKYANGDADDDGDVDLRDFGTLIACVGMPLAGECMALDLNDDGQVSADDLPVFAAAITGPMPAKGDLDRDSDVDLGDHAGFQVCVSKASHPEYLDFCLAADMDGDGAIDLHDLEIFVEHMTGPLSGRRP